MSAKCSRSNNHVKKKARKIKGRKKNKKKEAEKLKKKALADTIVLTYSLNWSLSKHIEVGEWTGVLPSRAGLWDLDRKMVGMELIFLKGEPKGEDTFLTGDLGGDLLLAGDPIGDFFKGDPTGDDKRSL